MFRRQTGGGKGLRADRKRKTPIYTFGPIIHNEEVVRDLEERGVKVLETAEELRQLTDGVVVIRSHGVGKDIYDILEKNGIEIIDATCPFVKKNSPDSKRTE